MLKKLFISTIIAVSPLAVFAADITNVEFDNGDVTVSGKGGSTVQAEFRIVVPATEVVEYVQTDVDGDGLAPVNHSIGGSLGLQEGTHNVKVSVKLPPNTGTYDLDVQTAGIYGGIRAIDGDDSVNGTETFSDALRTVSNSSSNSTSNNDDDEDAAPSWLSTIMAQFNALLAALNNNSGTTPPPAPVNASCAEYANLSMGLMQGSDTRPGGAVGRLQSFLMYKGFDIPLLSSNQAPYGFYGSQSAAAAASFRAANHCM